MSTRSECRLTLAGPLFVAALAAPVAAQATSRVSVDSGGVQGNDASYTARLSADGRYVAFESVAGNLVAGDTNGVSDVFVHDRQTGATERVSVHSNGSQGDDYSETPSISADGRYVAFASLANLVREDTSYVDVFVRDRQSGTTERVSVAWDGSQTTQSFAPSISADGRYVAFFSNGTNLVPGDTNGDYDVFVRDRQNATTERVSVSSGGAQGNDYSFNCSISADGRYVAFQSAATNLVSGDTNGSTDIFVRDRQSGTTERVSVHSGGAQGNSHSDDCSISGEGRFVAFRSAANNLVAGDTNGRWDVFVRDRQSGTTERVSVDSLGAQGNNHCHLPSISAGGRYVAFIGDASDLVSGDTNGVPDIFIRDRQSDTTERVSLSSGGAEGNAGSGDPSISADGRCVVFASEATNLVAGDTNGTSDTFVRDVRDPDYSPFTSLCHPGAAGVIACPCSNPPSALGRGCDNSAGAGGAILSASGLAYLWGDTLVFTTSDERPTALSIVLQGNALATSGIVYGQGVRCASGALKRLFTKTASGGSITAPDFGAGDPTVSARSAAKGDVILAGQNRWYLVYYRDPSVLGGCPAGSTFNATQTGEVAWFP